MSFIKGSVILVLMAIAVEATVKSDGYQYPVPPIPFDVTTTTPTSTTSGGYVYNTPKIPFPPTQDDHSHHEHGMPFAYKYAVKDDTFGTDFSENADSNGDVVRGEYRVALPDGRLQIVRYTADWKNGYNAEVTYEGTAKYPEDKKTNGPY